VPSDGEAGAGDADPEFELCYLDAYGGEHRELPAAWPGLRVETFMPAREFRWARSQRHLPGLWWSVTAGSHVGYESWLERDHVMLLDFDLRVTAIAAQPFWAALAWRHALSADLAVRLTRRLPSSPGRLRAVPGDRAAGRPGGLGVGDRVRFGGRDQVLIGVSGTSVRLADTAGDVVAVTMSGLLADSGTALAMWGLTRASCTR
jgi:hypothetical protein